MSEFPATASSIEAILFAAAGLANLLSPTAVRGPRHPGYICTGT